MIEAVIDMLSSRCGSIPGEVSGAVADIGRVHSADEGLRVGELVVLRANATRNSGEPCVAACETLSGWVIATAS